jgi:hypothetical protein
VAVLITVTILTMEMRQTTVPNTTVQKARPTDHLRLAATATILTIHMHAHLTATGRRTISMTAFSSELAPGLDGDSDQASGPIFITSTTSAALADSAAINSTILPTAAE